MARSEARVYCDIWDDDDFLALEAMAQRAYLFLLSQADLSHNGVVPLRIRRWARKSAGLDTAALRAHLQQLQDNGFIVMDLDTEELLVRSLMRRDRIFRQPNVMRAATDQTRQVDSTAILHALAGEVARIRTENPQLTREQDTALSEMENALAERGFAVSAASTERPGGNPTEMGYVNGSAITSVNASANASAEVLGERGGLQTVGSDSPSPIPLFPANPAVASLPSGSRSKRLDSARRRIPADFNVTDEMLKWARDNTPLVGKVETAQFVDWHLGAGSTKADWPATWRAWMRRAQAEAEQRLARASPVLPQTQGPGHKLFRPEDHD